MPDFAERSVHLKTVPLDPTLQGRRSTYVPLRRPLGVARLAP